MPPTTSRDNDDEPPLPPSTSTTRPPVSNDFGSDSSVDTLSSFVSSSTNSESSSGDHPYSRLVVVEAMAMGPPSDIGAWDVSYNLAETGGSQSHPGTRNGSFAIPGDGEPPDVLEHPASFVPPSLVATAPSSSSLRHQSLPGLITSPEVERRQNTTPKAPLFRSSAPTFSDESAISLTPDHSPAISPSATFAPASVSAAASTSSARYPPPSSTALTASMSRSHSSSFSQMPSPRSNRPGSSGTFSSTSSRPWVRDSDASSVCSGGSGSCWSGVGGPEDEDGSGEVLKVAADGVEFLDPRPEPKGAKLSIDREDLKVVILTVTLPGFSLDNITVAMRRGHKVHIVADSYGEGGGHFEKLISLGSGVSSAAPRAEFNGTELKVYVQRRAPRAPVAPAPQDHSPSISPPFSPSSPSSSSISSLSSMSLATSPSMTGSSAFVNAEDEPPIVTRSTADYPDSLHKKRGSRSLCGPEAAKAAAKKAREEAAQRAREEAKALPKVGRRVVLGKEARAAEDQSGKSSSSLQPLAVPPGRNGTIKGRSPSPISPVSISDSNSSGDSTSTRSSIDSAYTDPSSVDESSSTSPARPKFRGSNLTLRPADRTSFLEASLREDQRRAGEGGSSLSSEGSKSEGVATPKVERSETSWGFPSASASAGAPAERRV